MRETHASSTIHVYVVKFNAYFVHFYLSVSIGWKQRALVFSMKLSNANSVSTWIGVRLTLPGAVDFFQYFFFFFCTCSVFFFFFFFFFLLLFFVLFFCFFLFFFVCLFFCYFFLLFFVCLFVFVLFFVVVFPRPAISAISNLYVNFTT